MELIEFGADAFLEPTRLCLEREEAWRSRLRTRPSVEGRSPTCPGRRAPIWFPGLCSLGLAVLFGRIIPAAVLTAQRRRVDSRIRQDDAGTVAPGQSGDVAARVA